jgi:hypothetical protein
MFKNNWIKVLGIFCLFVFVVLGNIVGCGEDDDNNGGDGPIFNGELPPVEVTFKNYCTDDVTVYETDASGSTCTKVTSPVQLPLGGVPNPFSASTTGNPECDKGTRVEFTLSANGDVFYNISTNADDPPIFFNVPVRILALQNTASPPCALAEWDGTLCPPGSSSTLQCRCVSSQTCTDKPTSLDQDCKTGYLNPTSGPQFICRAHAANEYVVEWCPANNPSPVPTCKVPPFDQNQPCPNVCVEDATKAPFPCEDESPPHVMCDVAPFGGTPPESYCLLVSDCEKDGAPCECCTDNSQCPTATNCLDFLCQ